MRSEVNIDRGVEQLVARWAHNPEVVGSNPSPATRTPPEREAFLYIEVVASPLW